MEKDTDSRIRTRTRYLLTTLLSSEDELSPLSSKFPPPKIKGDYETQLSIPVPIGTIISEICFMEQMAVFPQPSENARFSYEPFYTDLVLEHSTTIDMNLIAIPCSSSSLSCVVCGNSTSSAHLSGMLQIYSRSM